MNDPIEERLIRAGQLWRASLSPPARPDIRRLPSRRRRRAITGPLRIWLPVTAAAVVTALVAGGTMLLTRSAGPAPRMVPGPASASTSPTPAGIRTTADLVVREGTVIEGSGTVLAKPDGSVTFCGPGAFPAIGPRPGQERVPPCGQGVPVAGVDLDTLTGADAQAGYRFGVARLRGVWRSGTLVVTSQHPPASGPGPEYGPDGTLRMDNVVPCPAPSGGWPFQQLDPGDGSDPDNVHQYVEQEHPDRFRQLRIVYPYGLPSSDPTPGMTAVQVLVVEVVRGDVEDERAEILRRVHGNVCVAAAPAGTPSIAEVRASSEHVQRLIDPLMRDQSNGISSLSAGEDGSTVTLVMITPLLYDAFTEIGWDLIHVEPWLLPVF